MLDNNNSDKYDSGNKSIFNSKSVSKFNEDTDYLGDMVEGISNKLNKVPNLNINMKKRRKMREEY